MTGRSVTYSLFLNSNVKESLRQTEAQASSLDKQMSSLRQTLYGLGTGFGTVRLFDIGKDWLHDVADLETGLLRVKNASDSVSEGIKNKFFINDEVNKFKTDLQETVDSYGSFLFKIRNANLGSELQRHLYDNLLTIGKVGALPQQEIDATIRNVGIMLGEGILEARHLRGLSYVHPQIVPFLAHAMGLDEKTLKGITDEKTDEQTASQKLSLLISSGKLTKSALDARVIITAIEDYKNSVKDKLPETLETFTSELNEVGNSALRLKSIYAQDLKPELISLFNTFKDSIKWLEDHKSSIIDIGGKVLEIVKVYTEWRLALLALQVPAAILGIFRNEYGRLLSIGKMYGIQTSIQTQLYREQTIAIISETDALIALNREQLLSKARVSAGTEMGEEVPLSGAIGGIGKIGTFIAGALLVALTAASIYELVLGLKASGKDSDVPAGKQISDFFKGKSIWESNMENSMNDASKRADEKSKGYDQYKSVLPREQDEELKKRLSELGIKATSKQINQLDETYRLAGESESPLEKLNRLYGKSKAMTGTSKYDDINGTYKGKENDPLVFKDALTDAVRQNILGAHSNLLEDVLRQEKLNSSTPDYSGLGKYKGKFGKDEKTHIRGNSITNITINIKDIIGMQNPKFSVNNIKDMEDIEKKVGIAVVKILTDAVNDSQIVAGKNK